ncbi:MAG: lamin tail domain-containing protein, partial [Anaerolineales bacterium]|nr:lamin tail domain-containing protein [Anaerolineales bacterium]
MMRSHRKLIYLALLALLLTASWGLGSDAKAATSDLFISEYIEGSSFNKAIEIYNGTGSAVDLAAGNYTLELYSNGAASPTASMALTGTIADGDVYVLAHASADPAILAEADVTNSSVINFNGDDAVVLRKDGAVVDAFGQVGFDPGSQWA